MAIIEFEFEGKTYEADDSAKNDYRFAYGMVKGSENLDAYFTAVDMLFPDGRHGRYAKEFGGDQESMLKLVTVAVDAIHAKN